MDRNTLTFTVETEREAEGRWIAEVMELPGVLAYGRTTQEAVAAVQALALHVLAEKLEHNECAPVRGYEFVDRAA